MLAEREEEEGEGGWGRALSARTTHCYGNNHLLQSLGCDDIMQLFHSTHSLSNRHTAIQFLQTQSVILNYRPVNTYPQHIFSYKWILLLVYMILVALLWRWIGSGAT